MEVSPKGVNLHRLQRGKGRWGEQLTIKEPTIFWGGRSREGNSEIRAENWPELKQDTTFKLHSKNYQGKVKISSYLKAFRANPKKKS